MLGLKGELYILSTYCGCLHLKNILGTELLLLPTTHTQRHRHTHTHTHCWSISTILCCSSNICSTQHRNFVTV